MQDRILSSFLKDFADERGLPGLTEAEAFERFATFCVVSKHHPDTFDVDQTALGGSGDLGIDGAAILVNEHLITSKEAVDHFKRALRRLDVQFIFVQAKTSPRFDGAAVGTFLRGVRLFFQSMVPDVANPTVAALHSVKEHVYDSSIDMDRSPSCLMYFVAPGTWQDDVHVRTIADQAVNDLRGTGLFSAVEFIPVDAEALKGFYRRLKHKITRQVAFEKHTILPPIAGVQEAYIGILPCREYLKLITDEEGGLNKRLFHDNVRDYQGHNAVNREIEAAIRDGGRSDRFALLNNGVTIVARDATKVGATFRLKDYQVVNGCQTTHVLFLNRESLTERVYLPIKLIVTGDAEVTNQIIQGTNRQTEVKLEAFHSLAPFHKKLEEYYLASSRDLAYRLYYERRSRQYEHLGLLREQIITLPTQTLCFLAMFLNEPHSTHRYYGELLSSYESRLFAESHSPAPYFASGLALSVVERLFARDRLQRDLKPFRFQLLMLLRLLMSDGLPPPLNSKKIEAYCQELVTVLGNDVEAERVCLAAADLVRRECAKPRVGREPIERTRALTEALVEAATGAKITAVAEVTRERGTIKWFSPVRGYGFIAAAGGEIFVHFSAVKEKGFRYPQPGEVVEYVCVESAKGKQAEDVHIVSPLPT